MPTNLTCLKVFIASPSGLSDERRAFRDEIKQYNESDAIPRGVFFEPVGWEDTLGRVGRPQSIINEDVRESDYFVLLLWDRWGSPPDTKVDQPFSSGTEEEYHVALKCHGDGALPMRQLVLMFKAVDARQLSDPGRQLDKVLEFREKIEREKSHLFHSFDTPEGFRILLRRHLADWLRDQENGPGGDGENQAEALDMVSVEPVKEDPVISGPPEPLTAKAWSLADAGRLTKAEVEFARATVGRQNPDPLVSYAQFLLRVGRLDQARVLSERAAEVAQDQTDEPALSRAFDSLANGLWLQGDLGGAEEMTRKSLEIEIKLGRLEGMASSYGNLGIFLRTRGDLDGAEEMFRRSLKIKEKLGQSEDMAINYGNLGNMFLTRGDLDGAEEMFRKSLEINEKLGQSEGMASQYGNLGNLLLTRGDLDKAEEMYRKSLEINEKLGRSWARPRGMALRVSSLSLWGLTRRQTQLPC